MHAFHIDAVDLVFESVGAPFLLFGGQCLLGMPVGIHWLSVVLLTFHDASLHSMNPYSEMYFSPLLDWQLHANVTRQLHHALNTGYYRSFRLVAARVLGEAQGRLSEVQQGVQHRFHLQLIHEQDA